MKPKMKPSQACYELIKKFEGLVLNAYRDKAGIWTIGYGCTFYENGAAVRMGDRISKERAQKLFKFIVDDFALHVDKLVTSRINQHQFDALVSIAYNIGLDIDRDVIPEGFGDSTLLKMVNKNPNDPLIYKEFQKWNKVTINGKKVVLADLTYRRKIEADLYFRK